MYANTNCIQFNINLSKSNINNIFFIKEITILKEKLRFNVYVDMIKKKL